MRKNSQIEQVWFLSCETKTLVMAGGEFCANAARAAIWQLLAGKSWTTILSVSWYDGSVYGSVLDGGKVRLELKKDFCRSLRINDSLLGIVHLQWISHLIVPMREELTIETLKDAAKWYLEKFWLLSYDAAGVMFISVVNNIISLYPVVWVRDMQTFIFESACGSGTIAYALYAYQLTKATHASVLQPSGSILEVEISDDLIHLIGEVDFVQNI